MDNEELIKATAELNDCKDFLSLLNHILVEERGDRVSLFSQKQLLFFSNISCNKRLYKTFTIPKKSGGCRQILAPERNLKEMQRCLNRILQAMYQAPSCANGFIPHRSIAHNASIHVGNKYVFNTDLKDFFTSITYDNVYKSLIIRPFEFPAIIARTIAGLCCTEINIDGQSQFALPQGAPTSPIVANIVCLPLDRKCAGLARRFSASYSRYADDITFSCDKNAFFPGSDFMLEFQRIIESQFFCINHTKDRVQNYAGRQEVTGVVVNKKVNVSKQYIRDLDNLLFIWERYGREMAKIKYCHHHPEARGRQGFDKSFERIIIGRLNYLRMIRGKDDHLYQKLSSRLNSLLLSHTSKVKSLQ